jgi:hypothetical protein
LTVVYPIKRNLQQSFVLENRPPVANFAAKQSPGDPGKQSLGELNRYPDTPGVQEFCT